MKRAFTLLELLIVIIIVGIMATLGLINYATVVEKSRGMEARRIIGQLRKICASFYMEKYNISLCNADSLGLGNGQDGTIPSTACFGTHYFKYEISLTLPEQAVFTATRCLASESGKPPGVNNARNISLAVDFGAQTDVWTSPNGY